MNTTWIVIEALAVLVEDAAMIYFLNSHFKAKHESWVPQALAWFIMVCWGLLATFLELPLYDLIGFIMLFLYLFLAKQGTFLLKLFDAALCWAIFLGTSFIGAGLSALLMHVTVEYTQLYQDNSRLFAMIFIKTLQVITYYILAKKHYHIHSLRRRSILMLSLTVAIVLICLLYILVNIPYFSPQSNDVFMSLAIGFLIILIMIFALYEMFVQEETYNADLSGRLQRLELEIHFFSELGAVYSELRTWRHEYKNNLIAIKSLVEHEEMEKTIHYIDEISATSTHEEAMLQTGNIVLDAVVSSKLWLAKSCGIEVDVQTAYPEGNHIEDNDLCAIVGNLLDNAIEACGRLDGTRHKRFISLSLLVKGKNLTISISNSFNGEIKKEGERYFTSKDGAFHGIGIRHVDSIVDKYQGHVLREYGDWVFNTYVMLPMVPSSG